MKKYLFAFSFMALSALPLTSHADGIPEEPAPARRHRVSRAAAVEEPTPPPPSCVSQSPSPKVKLLSWDPKQKVAKFLGVLKECSTNQWDVLKLLSGPNVIGLSYPDEHEKWSYLWLWRYKLQNPMEETVILMDKQSKRLMKGKDPVELNLTFNKEDVLEKVEMILVKKGGNYMVVP